MHALINEYLFSAHKCSLPPLGTFTRVYHSAQIDSVNKRIYPPFTQIIFDSALLPVSKGLIEFAAFKNNTTEETATSDIEHFCNGWIEKIINGEALCFEGFGCINQNEEGELFFDAYTRQQTLAVLPAEKVLHKDAGHNVLVGDRETTSQVMKDYYSEKPLTASRKWMLRAAILLAIGLVIIIISLYNRGFAPDSIGNGHHLKINDEPKTYNKVE